MGYSINGVPLDNAATGWSVLAPSAPRAGRSRERTTIAGPGRDGRARTNGRTPAPTIPLKVKTPVESYESLRALFRLASTIGFDGPPEIVAECDFLACTPTRIYEDPKGSRYDVEALLDLPDVYWRDVVESTSPAAAIGAASVAVEVFPGLSAPVRDSIVRLAGGFTGLRVDGSDGTFFTYAPNVPSGSFLRFHSDTGQAWVTTSDTWVGGTEVSGSVFTGPGPYPLELDVADPISRSAVLTITTTVRSGSPSVQVRGRAAYDH